MPAKYKIKCTCGQLFVVDDKWLGKKIRCPKCQKVVAVPEGPTSPAAAGPAAPAPAAPAQPTPAAAPAAEPEPESEQPADDNAAEEQEEAEGPEPGASLVAEVDGFEIEFEDPTEKVVAPQESLVGLVGPDPAAEAMEGIDDIDTGLEAAPDPEAEPAPPAAESGAGSGAAAAAHAGLDLSTLTECPHCANEIEPGTVFCINCGTDLKTGRKLRKVKVEEEGKGGYDYEPPEEGTCVLCDKEGVEVVQVSRDEMLASNKFLKSVTKDVDKKSPTESDIQMAARAKIKDAKLTPVCQKCGRKFKVGPRKFKDLIVADEVEETTEQADAAADDGKKKSGFVGKLFGKKKSGGE